MRAAWVIAVAMAASGAAMAQSRSDGVVALYMTGENLTPRCRAYLTAVRAQWKVPGQVAVDAAVCRGFVTGVVDVVSFEEIAGKREYGDGYCLPVGVNVDTLTEVVANFADKNPQRRVASAYSMVRTALSEAYPCR